MAKDQERKLARIYYVEHGKDAKEIALTLNVSEPTLSKWVNKYGWKEQRNAMLNNPKSRSDNLKEIINDLSEQRLAEQRKLKDAEEKQDKESIMSIRAVIARIDDAVSRWNKTLETIDKETKISLTVYISVMEQIFNALKLESPELFIKTISFQEKHLNEISMKYK